MTPTATPHPHRWLRARGALATAALLLAALAAATARAGCMADVLRQDGEFTGRLETEPSESAAALRALIEAEQRAPGSTAFRLPPLHAMLAEAGYHAGTLDVALADARRGLALAPLDAPTRHRLEVVVGQVLEARDQLPAALAAFERLAAAVPADAPYRRCVLTERGYLRFLNGLMGAAVTDLTAAYDAERRQGNRGRMMMVAGILSSIYAQVGFFDEARELTEDMIAFHTRTRDAHGQADGYYRRGTVRFRSGDLVGAEADLRKSLEFARTQTDPFDTGYAALELCKVLEKAGRPAEAIVLCDEVATIGRRVDSDYFVSVARGYRAAADAALGRPQVAAAVLDQLLDQPQPAFSPGIGSEFHLIRARVRAALGDHQGAYRDAGIYIEEAERIRDQRSAQRVEVLRVRFEADRKTHALWAEQEHTAKLENVAAQARIARNLVIAGGGLLLLLTLAAVWAVRRRAALQAQARIARARLGLVSRLTAGVAHEFNNLLTVVQQSTSLLEREPAMRTNPDAAQPLQATREAVRAAAALTNQLLALGGHDRPQPGPVRLAAFLQRIEPDLRRACGEANTLAIDVAADLPAIAVDAGQLHHALLAVLTNACDAISPARAGQVTLRARPESAKAPPVRGVRAGVAIEIVDDGPGMSDEVLRRACEPFFTTKEVGKGAGLGLSVVDAFARQSGGLLRLASTPGGGTTVALWLPIDAAEPQP